MKYQFLKFFSCCFVLFFCTANVIAQSEKDALLLKKNFPFLYMLEEYMGISYQSQYFEKVRNRVLHDAGEAITNCKIASCYSSRLQFTGDEIALIGNELVRWVTEDKSIAFWLQSLKKERFYPLYCNEPDSAYIRKIWQAEARGIGYILNTYIGAQKPLYPKIDSISFKKEDPAFCDTIKTQVSKILANKPYFFFSLPLLFSIEALKVNDRDEAARYEPLKAEENAAAYKRVKKIKWKKYPYSVILVPGLGPEQPDVRLDPNGAKRCDSAAVRYREGKAPFVVVSGGHVHPNKTPYCEAIEMKKYMVEVWHIPASAIIIEPHARHTTTNLRNTNRLLFLFEMPLNKPVLIVTDAAQNNYINGSMKDKVVKELGYTPFSSITKLSATETAYLPSGNSRQANSLDPLDP